MLKVAQAAPEFDLEASTGGRLSLSDLRGRFAVIIFYVKDDTLG